MALEPCRECGTNVSDAAQTCPTCGVSDPVQSETWLIVTRKSKLKGALNNYYLTIDGKTDTISGGSMIKLRLKPGPHQIELEVDGPGAKRLQRAFDINTGQTVEYDIGFSGWSGVKLDRVR